MSDSCSAVCTICVPLAVAVEELAIIPKAKPKIRDESAVRWISLIPTSNPRPGYSLSCQ
jgi:hypothetical protein